jgi:hypothetical protein
LNSKDLELDRENLESLNWGIRPEKLMNSSFEMKNQLYRSVDLSAFTLPDNYVPDNYALSVPELREE